MAVFGRGVDGGDRVVVEEGEGNVSVTECSERHEATDGEKRPREADSSDTSEREEAVWGLRG